MRKVQGGGAGVEEWRAREGVGLAALEEYEAAIAVFGSQHGLEVERVALMHFPEVGGDDDEAGRRVAETALQNRSVAIEVEQKRRDLFLKSIKKQRIGGRDYAGDFFSGGAERIVAAGEHFCARYIDEVEDCQPGA